jgi:hypothetical protein
MVDKLGKKAVMIRQEKKNRPGFFAGRAIAFKKQAQNRGGKRDSRGDARWFCGENAGCAWSITHPVFTSMDHN